MGEAKDDIWICTQVGVRLGLDPELIDPVSLPGRSTTPQPAQS